MIASDTVSAAPSEIASIIALLFLSIFVLLIERYYLPLRTTPAYVLVTVFFALWLPAAIVLLVPIDLASSARTDDERTRGVWLPDRAIVVAWRISYWLTFCLTWFILPILAEYSDAGYREPQGKLLYSLRSNAQYYITVFGFGILGLVYAFLYYGIHLDSLKGPVIALAYSWGLVLAIYLMGHGLVAIPRSLMRNASITGRLRRLQSRAPKVFEKFQEAEAILEDFEMQVVELGRRKINSAAIYRDWIEELQDMTSFSTHPITSSTTGVRGTGNAQQVPTVITEKYMADLTRNIMRAKQARSRHAKGWNDLVSEAGKVQAILDSGPSKHLSFGDRSAPHAAWYDKLNLFTPYTRYLLHFHVLPVARYVLAAVLSLASFCIIWSEIVKVGKASLSNLSIIRLTVVHHWPGGEKNQVGFAGQAISAFWITYMCAAALTSITEVKVWRGRALVKGNTAYESAFWYSSYVARLSVPISYNFITFLSRSVYSKTHFYDFLGRLVDLTPLGEWFNRLFPLLILVPVCATLFGLYGKVKRYVGISDIIGGNADGFNYADDDDDNGGGGGDEEGARNAYGTGSWREGRDLLERELNGTSIHAAATSTGAGRSAPIRSIPGGSPAPNETRRQQGAITPFGTSPDLAPANGGFTTTTRSSARVPAGARAGMGAGARGAVGTSSRRYRRDDLSGGAEDEGFFASFGHRLRNTVDTIDKPRWLQDIPKPKWMGGNGTTSGAAGAGADAGARGSDNGNHGRPGTLGRTGSEVRRWFGGNDGRIRL